MRIVIFLFFILFTVHTQAVNTQNAYSSYSLSFSLEGFIENKGQFITFANREDSLPVFCKYTQGKFSICLHSEGLIFSLGGTPLFLDLVNAKIERENIVFSDPLVSFLNFVYPHCPQGVYGVRIYKKVHIKNIYPNIDWLIYIDDEGKIKQDFIIYPNADYRQIQFKIRNANRVKIEKKTSLVFKNKKGKIYDHKAVSYLKSDTNTKIQTHFIKRKGTIGFELALDNGLHTDTLVIDPVITWATYINSAYNDSCLLYQIVDAGNGFFAVGRAFSPISTDAYITIEKNKKQTIKTKAPGTPGDSIRYKDHAFYASFNPKLDAVVYKYTYSGALEWATYYGSLDTQEEIMSAVVSEQGKLFCGGSVLQKNPWGSPQFPPTIEQQGTYNQSTKGPVFFLELDSLGKIEWASYFMHIAYRKAEITSMLLNGKNDLFVAVNKNISSVYSGGEGLEEVYYAEKDAFIFDRDKYHGERDSSPGEFSFLIKFDIDKKLRWFTAIDCAPLYLNLQFIYDIDMDSKGNLYILGLRGVLNELPDGKPPYDCSDPSSDRYGPPLSRFQEGAFNGSIQWRDAAKSMDGVRGDIDALKGAHDIFLYKFDSALRWTWATTIPGAWEDKPYSLEMANNDHFFITGYTRSKDFPLVKKNEGFNLKNEGRRTGFLMEFDTANQLIWSTHLPSEDGTISTGTHINCTPNKHVYVYGIRNGIDYPIPENLRDILEYDNSFNPEVNFRLCENYLKSVDTSFSTSFLLHFDDKRKLIQNIDLDIYGNEIDKFFYPISAYHVFRELPSISNIHRSFMDSTGNTYFLSQRIGNTLLRASDSKQSIHQNDKAYPQTGNFLLRVSACAPSETKVTIGKDTLLCEGDSIVLKIPQDFSEYTFTWTHDTNYHGDTLKTDHVGEYTVHLVSFYPTCPDLMSHTIKIDTIPPPILIFPKDTLVYCVGEYLHLDVSNKGAQYLWFDGQDTAIRNFGFTGDSILPISCMVYTPCGDTVVDSMVLAFAPPYIYLGNDSLLCPQDSLCLNASLYNENYACKYTWFVDGEFYGNKHMYTIVHDTVSVNEKDTNYIRVKQNTHIAVEVTLRDAPLGSCIARDTVEYQYYRHSPPDIQINDTAMCRGGEIELFADYPDASFLWIDERGNIISKNNSFRTADTGNFIVSVQNYCYKEIDSFAIDFFPAQWTAINLPPDTMLCIPNTLYLNVEVENPNTNYTWSDDTENHSSQRNISSSGIYTITLTDHKECSNAHTINVEIKECVPKMELPNVFTPNGDGINDDIKANTQEFIHDFEIQIFNSWGLLVFSYQGDIENFSWNGTHKNTNKEAPDGSYFWIATFKDLLGEKYKNTGVIMLLR